MPILQAGVSHSVACSVLLRPFMCGLHTTCSLGIRTVIYGLSYFLFCTHGLVCGLCVICRRSVTFDPFYFVSLPMPVTRRTRTFSLVFIPCAAAVSDAAVHCASAWVPAALTACEALTTALAASEAFNGSSGSQLSCSSGNCLIVVPRVFIAVVHADWRGAAAGCGV